MLLELWEAFAQLSRQHRDNDKSSAIKKQQNLLDKFLLEFLAESALKNGSSLCEMKNVSNTLCHEFMRDMLSVTSAMGDSDDTTQLEDYLLRGHGWMLLCVVHQIGLQGVYSRQDLCNILLTLLPFCLKIPPTSSNNNHTSESSLVFFDIDPETTVDMRFQWMDEALKQQKAERPQMMRKHKVKTGRSGCLHSHRKCYKKTMPRRGGYQDSDAEDDVQKGKQPRQKKSLKTQAWASVSKDDESVSDEDFADSSDEVSLSDRCIDAFQLFQLLLTLLHDLAVLDITAVSPGHALTSSILPVMLDVLLTVTQSGKDGQSQETGSTLNLPWGREKGVVLHQQLLRVIVTVCAIAATQQNGVRMLLSLKVVPIVLSSLAYLHFNSNVDGPLSETEHSVINQAVCGCLGLFSVIYKHLPFNPSFIRDANALLELFRRHKGEDYFRYLYTVGNIESRENGERYLEPIKWLCHLIHSLKGLKVDYVHGMKCLKRRHRNCDYGNFFHHHHDLFGAPVECVLPWKEESCIVQTKLTDPALCQVAKCAYLLLECLKRAKSKKMQLLILSALQEQGMCCCLQPALLVNVISPMLPSLSASIRNYALDVLNTMLLTQFEGSADRHEGATVTCGQCLPDQLVTNISALHLDSGFCSRDMMDTTDQQRVLQWQSLRLLRQHILSFDENLALTVAKHLITLAIKGNSIVKEELFFGVYLHVLNMRAAEQTNEMKGEREDLTLYSEDSCQTTTVSNSVMLFCISALPYVLQVNKVLRLFLEKGGLARLTQLLDSEQLRRPVMGVFEALIMLDEQAMTGSSVSLTASSSDLSGQYKMSSDQGVQYKGGIVIQTFIDTLAQKTCSITAMFQQLQLKGPLSVSTLAQQGQNSGADGEHDCGVGLSGYDHKCMADTLPSLQDMWTTCAKLCMNSETFRACYRNSPCLYIVQETLVLAMSILTDSVPNTSDQQQVTSETWAGGKQASLACHLSRLSFIEAVMIVCFSCQTIQPLQEVGLEQEMWLRIRRRLQQCVDLEPSKLRAVFDMLLNAAQPQLPSILQYSYAQITSTLCQQESEDVEDESDMKTLAQQWSDEELDADGTEQGYEADTESVDYGESQDDADGQWWAQHGGVSSGQCFPAVLRLFVELLVAGQDSASGQAVCLPVLLRLLHMLRCSRLLATAACKQGLVGLLLGGFQHLIVQPSQQEQSGVQEVLLTIVQTLGQVEMSSSELAMLFHIFAKTTNLACLLSTLTGVVENSVVAPSTFLTFPAKASAHYSQHSSLPEASGGAEGVDSVSAIQCEVCDLQWPPLEAGFSLSVWFSMDSNKSPVSTSTSKAQDQEEVAWLPMVQDCVHLVSLGDDSKTFQVWMHLSSSTLLFRLWSCKYSGGLLKEAAVRVSLSEHHWHSLVFSYHDILDGSTSLGKLWVHVDGRLQEQQVLDHPASIWHRLQSKVGPCLRLGHLASHNDTLWLGRYSMGSVLLFADSEVSSEFWFHLHALGPTFGALAKCDCGLPPVTYAGLLHKDLVSSRTLNHDVLVGILPVPDLDKAQAAQRVYFDAQNWSSFCQYKHVAEGGSGSLLGLVPPPGSLDTLLRQCPEVMRCTVNCQPEVSTHTNLPTALEQHGGVQTLLFLVAKVFEEGGLSCIQVQSKAVQLLLAMLDHFPPVCGAFSNMQGYDMLSVVLRTSPASITPTLLKVLFDASTSESVFRVDSGSGLLVLRRSSESIIRNMTVVTQLLLCWQIWQRAEMDLMELILSALVLLQHPNHPHRAFNIRQLQAAGIIKTLFNIYLERIQEDLPPLSSVCSRHVASIVASVVGQPPDLALLASITDFLLQQHPPTTRFINYMPAAFYLSPCWVEDPQARSLPMKGRGDERGTSSATASQNSQQQEGAMEAVQIHSQHVSSTDTHWGSNEGSDIAEVDRTAHAEGSTHYPPLEPTTSITLRSFCLETSLSSLDRKQSEEEACEDQGAPRHADGGTDMMDSKRETGENSLLAAGDCVLTSAEKVRSNTMSTASSGEMSSWKLDSQDSGAQHTGHWSPGTGDSEESDVPSPSPTSNPLHSSGHTMHQCEQGLDTLCHCLLQYLCKVVREQPQQDVDEVFCQVINPRALLLLAQSSCTAIRIAVVQVMCEYLCRAPLAMLEDFLKEDGLFLLANQLSAFPVCQLQVEAAFSLLFQHSFTFKDNYMVGELGAVGELQQTAPVLVLSMLNRILPDLALCHNTLSLVSQVIEKTPVMSRVLIDLGLPEVLCNLLFTAQLHNFSPDVCGADSGQMILLDVQNIFCQLAVTQFSWSGAGNYQLLEHLFKILQAMEDKEKQREEVGLNRAETSRALQYAMMVSLLDWVQDQGQDSKVNSSSSGASRTVQGRGLSVPARTLSSGLLTNSKYSVTSQRHDTHVNGHARHHSQKLRPVQSAPQVPGVAGVPVKRQLSAGVPVGNGGAGQVGVVEEGKPSILQRLFSRKKHLEVTHIKQDELVERFKKFLVLAVDLLLFQDRTEKIKPQWQHTMNFLSEASFQNLDDRHLFHVFTFLFQALLFTLQTRDSFHKSSRQSVLIGVKEVLRVQLGRVVACLLSPKMECHQRIYILCYLMGDNHGGRDVMRLLVRTQHLSTELGLGVHELLSEWREWLSPNHRDLAMTLMTLLKQNGCTFVADIPASPEQAESLREEKKTFASHFNQDKQEWLSKRSASSTRVHHKFKEMVKRVQGHAITLTQLMGAQQVRERSSLVEHIKHTMATQLQLKKNWQDIVQSVTHERAVWHHAESYPQSWELDPTEGPGRIRRRLMRCHLGLHTKYIQKPFQHRLACEEMRPPLKYLFEDNHQVADSATLVYKLFTNDTVHNTFICTAVSPASESKGELLLGEQYFYFVADNAITDTHFTQMLLGNKDQLSLMWRYAELQEVHCRWYQLQDTALEMFVVTGRTHLLAFTSTADRDAVLELLVSQVDRPKGGDDQTVSVMQRLWLEGHLTNFDYLVSLNKLAGRSFNDLMQYPVFPFVLRDYESQELDLDNTYSFRKLCKPIAVQDKSRERKYMDNFEFLRQEMQKPGPDEVLRVGPYHYGSHYSNSGTVLHYLVRLPPFTRMFLAYQDRSFDIPDRTFHSIRTSWRLSSFESSTDVKELIPEFFYLPEFLVNSEGFDFGMRQNGEVVNDVLLPAWCQGDPRLFVLIHRQALESVESSRMLHHWLDLVFGFKQTGEEAVKAINVFHPSTYFGMDVSSVSDPLKRQALLTMIRTYGQTPKQLFTSPHPQSDVSPVTMAAADKRTYVPRPVSTVNGLRWGKYVGSPELPQPACQRVKQLSVPIVSLVPLASGPVFGIEANSTLITLHAKAQGNSLKQWDVLWAGAVTWGHRDNILRVVSHNKKPVINLMPASPYDKVTCCASALDTSLLFVASTSGSISAFNITHNVAKPSTLHVWGLRRLLCGHQGAVTVLQVCKPFSILVSGSLDHTTVIWDLNRLMYVRRVSEHKGPVTAVAVSPTLGDVASVSTCGNGSELLVHTINGRQVGSCNCEAVITCLTYSSAPEGRSINVIAGGLSTGVVRLWSSWDVSPVRDLSDDIAISHSILSVAYSSSSQTLYASLSDGTVIMWYTDKAATQASDSYFMPVLRHA